MAQRRTYLSNSKSWNTRTYTLLDIRALSLTLHGQYHADTISCRDVGRVMAETISCSDERRREHAGTSWLQHMWRAGFSKQSPGSWQWSEGRPNRLTTEISQPMSSRPKEHTAKYSLLIGRVVVSFVFVESVQPVLVFVVWIEIPFLICLSLSPVALV